MDNHKFLNTSSFITSNPLHDLLCSFASSSYTRFFHHLNRKHSRILASFLDNKAPLRSFLYTINLVDSQDNIHILKFCPSLSYQRHNSFHSSTFSPSELLHFFTISAIIQLVFTFRGLIILIYHFSLMLISQSLSDIQGLLL